MDNNTNGLVIHAGTNSLRWGLKLSDEQIAEQVINIGKDGMNDGVEKVFISSLIFRGPKTKFLNPRILNINRILYELCQQNGFIFINNDNITADFISPIDDIHLKDEGTVLLKQNFLRALF